MPQAGPLMEEEDAPVCWEDLMGGRGVKAVAADPRCSAFLCEIRRWPGSERGMKKGKWYFPLGMAVLFERHPFKLPWQRKWVR